MESWNHWTQSAKTPLFATYLIRSIRSATAKKSVGIQLGRANYLHCRTCQPTERTCFTFILALYSADFLSVIPNQPNFWNQKFTPT